MPAHTPRSILTISMEPSAPVLHDALLLCIGVAAVYLVVAVLQLFQLKGASTKSARHVCEPSLGHLPSVDGMAPAEDEGFNVRLLQSQIDAMFKRLAGEMERLGSEVQALRNELQRRSGAASPLADQSHPKLPAAATHYNQAMAFARASMSATSIALKCNVSLGEAELVIALVRGTDQGAHLRHPTSAPDQNSTRLNEQPHDGYRAAA